MTLNHRTSFHTSRCSSDPVLLQETESEFLINNKQQVGPVVQQNLQRVLTSRCSVKAFASSMIVHMYQSFVLALVSFWNLSSSTSFRSAPLERHSWQLNCYNNDYHRVLRHWRFSVQNIQWTNSYSSTEFSTILLVAGVPASMAHIEFEDLAGSPYHELQEHPSVSTLGIVWEPVSDSKVEMSCVTNNHCCQVSMQRLWTKFRRPTLLNWSPNNY